MIRILLVLFIFATAGCLQTENSSSLDSDRYNGDGVRQILAMNCAASCHSFHSMSDEQLVQSGFVVAGSPDDSPIYFRLIGSPAPMGDKDMPAGGQPPLTEEEILAIKIWIENM